MCFHPHLSTVVMALMSVPFSSRQTSPTRFLSACLCTVLLLMSVFHTGISSVKADVRCYCNLPVCVTSGYMCKSALGICVSDHYVYSGDKGNVRRSRHSCLELLRTTRKGSAPECPEDLTSDTEEDNPPSNVDGGVSENGYPTRVCCREDMCNYARNPADQPSHKLNQSYMPGYATNENYFYRHNSVGPSGMAAQQHVWFKAAVIAVPIAGGFILILLIIMAARMLRDDTKRHQQRAKELADQIRSEKSYVDTKIVYNCSKSHSGFLVMPKSNSSAIVNVHPQLHKNFVSAGCIDQPFHNSLYRNVSIAVSTDTSCTDSSRDKYFVFDV